RQPRRQLNARADRNLETDDPGDGARPRRRHRRRLAPERGWPVPADRRLPRSQGRAASARRRELDRAEPAGQRVASGGAADLLAFASYLADQAPHGQPMREELDLIQEEAGRARDIVRDLLPFTRQREFVPQVTDLNQVLEQTLAMVRRQGAFDSITLHEEYA